MYYYLCTVYVSNFHLLKTNSCTIYTFTFTLKHHKNVKMFHKSVNIINKPYMFRSLPQDHLQGSSLFFSAYHVFASRFVICLCWYVVVCPLFVLVCGCMPSVLVCGCMPSVCAGMWLYALCLCWYVVVCPVCICTPCTCLCAVLS
jgi:hypothetical protein